MLVFATKNMFTPYGLLEIHQYFFFSSVFFPEYGLSFGCFCNQVESFGKYRNIWIIKNQWQFCFTEVTFLEY